MSPSLVSQQKTVYKNTFLFLTLPVIFFFLHNTNHFKELIFTPEVLLLFLIYLIFSLFIFASIKILFRLTSIQSKIISILIIVSFLFFGVLQDYLFKKLPFLSNSFFLLPIIIVVIFSILMFLKKKKISPVAVNRYLTILFLILISYETVRLGIKTISGKSMYAITRRMISPVLDDAKILSKEQPDIYHIIFDGYTNLPALKEYWKYDNDIYSFLSSRGFYTLDSAISNYKTTPFSISSIFNLQYLNGADPYLDRTSVNFYIGQMVYRNNLLFNFLKRAHYSFSIFSPLEDEKLMTGFGFLGVHKPVDWLRSLTLERIYLNPWLLNKLKRFLGIPEKQPALILQSMHDFADYNKIAMNHIISDCQKISNQKLTLPVFNYTHFMLPHEPYVLDENGNVIPTAQPETNDMKGYLGQVKFSNKLIKQITDCLLRDTIRKKIIIFQGDHGYRSYTNAPFIAPYKALNAIYFYNKDYIGLKKTLSHVNTYRVVLNNCFNYNLPLLKDSIVFRNRQ